jgi:membrane fusion protein (multidrug efflux system)
MYAINWLGCNHTKTPPQIVFKRGIHVMKLSLRIFSLGIAIIASFQWAYAQPAPGQMKPKLVEVADVEPTAVYKTLSLMGSVKSQKQTHLIAEVQGIMSKIYAKEGERVFEGEVLAHLKNDDLKKSYELAVANEKVAQTHYERLQSLFRNEQLSKKELESAEREKNSAEIVVQVAKKKWDQTQFVAPFDGVCGVFKVAEGAAVGVGDMIVTLYDPQQLFVEFSVAEWLFDKIHKGQRVWVNDQESEIISIQKAVDPHTHMGLAKADLKDHEFYVGMTVTVKVVTDHLKNVLALPREAVFIQDAKQNVYVIKDDRAVLTPVEVGLWGDENVEVKTGLQKGDKVILRGHNRVFNGMPVRAYDVPESPVD